ncbi:GSCOCG00001451001-RA-CDS [Cotesia congregata]|nr:GSCOCG00001451001-RA-CDS [Cotesia congregata]
MGNVHTCGPNEALVVSGNLFIYLFIFFINYLL